MPVRGRTQSKGVPLASSLAQAQHEAQRTSVREAAYLEYLRDTLQATHLVCEAATRSESCPGLDDLDWQERHIVGASAIVGAQIACRARDQVTHTEQVRSQCACQRGCRPVLATGDEQGAS